MPNYYEYAPIAVQWLADTNVYPWTVLIFILCGLLILGMVFVCLSIFSKRRKVLTRLAFLVVGALFLVCSMCFDIFYLYYEFKKACDSPSVYIKKQVEADGWLEVTNHTSLPFSIEELLSLKNTPTLPNDDIWIKEDKEHCEFGRNYEGYTYKEEMSIIKDDVLKYRRFPVFRDLSGTGKEERIDYISSYLGLKDGECYQGYLKESRSRYYFIRENEGKRVGLVLKRFEAYIVDSETGEKIAHSYDFSPYIDYTKAVEKEIALSLPFVSSLRNTIYKFLEDVFRPTDYSCKDIKITSDQGLEIKEFRKTNLPEDAGALMKRYTLIPSQYLNN